MERTATNSVKYDNRKVVGNQHIFQIQLPKIHSDFESDLQCGFFRPECTYKQNPEKTDKNDHHPNFSPQLPSKPR